LSSKIALLFFLFVTILSYSQTKKELYNHILHENILNDDKVLDSSVNTILTEAELSPELLYYRVAFLNELYGNKNIDKKTNGFFELQNAKRKYTIERNSWLLNQTKTIDEKYYANKYHSSISSIFENLLLTSPKQKTLPQEAINENLMNFYVMFYYSNGETNKYDKNRDYSISRKEYESKVANEIEIIESALKSNKNIDTKNIYKKIEKNVYILSKTPKKINLVEILFLQKKKEYNIDNINRISFGFYYFANITNNKIETLSIKQNILDIDNLGQITFENLWHFGMSYKVFFKPEVEFLSYINFSASYTKVETTIEINVEPEYLRRTVSNTPSVKIFEFYDMHKLEANSINNDRIEISVSAPIIILNPKITLDVGLSLSYQNFGYMTYTLYDYRKIKSYYRSDGFFDYAEELENIKGIEESNTIDDSTYRISPLVSLNAWNVLGLLDF